MPLLVSTYNTLLLMLFRKIAIFKARVVLPFVEPPTIILFLDN
jgi:hypothetical protein